MIICPVQGASIRRPDTYTKLLFRMNGEGSVFTDLTGKSVVVTNAVHSPSQKKFIGNSGYFDGDGDYLSILNTNCGDFQFGAGNFTLEGYFYILSLGVHRSLIAFNRSGSYEGYCVYIDASNVVNMQADFYGWNIATKSGITTGWHHIAVVRNGTALSVSIDGVFGTSLSISGNMTASGSDMFLGASPTHSVYSQIYVREVRFSNIARYTSDFTPPTRRK